MYPYEWFLVGSNTRLLEPLLLFHVGQKKGKKKTEVKCHAQGLVNASSLEENVHQIMPYNCMGIHSVSSMQASFFPGGHAEEAR